MPTVYQTTSTFGANTKPLHVGNPILFRSAGTGKVCPAIVTRVSTTGPTMIIFAEDTAEIPGVAIGDGTNDIPFDDQATGPSDMRSGYWYVIQAPPANA